jgi:hypothetical protein
MKDQYGLSPEDRMRMAREFGGPELEERVRRELHEWADGIEPAQSLDDIRDRTYRPVVVASLVVFRLAFLAAFVTGIISGIIIGIQMRGH